jgi:RND family efflux transporter MFP subunit
MNELSPLPDQGVPVQQPLDRRESRPEAPETRSGGRRTLAIVVLFVLAGALAYGFWQHYRLHAEVIATADARRDFVPSVRTAAIKASDSVMSVTWPGTTEAFEQANIYARASGYISKRNVDIGSRVKAGDLLVTITAPEVEHQIAQAQGTLEQLRAALLQAEANRDLAQVTWDRDKKLVLQGWFTQQHGDTDRLTLEARVAAVAVASANITAQEAQLRVLNQTKTYQSVVAPFDGVITQRNVDVGSLVQGNVTGGTFMFEIMQNDVIRIWVYVPQDAAFGVAPGVDAVVRVPELPDREFRGKVTRIADAQQSGTRTLLTEIDLPNPDGALRSGVYCTVEFKIPRKTPSFVVPSEAIIFNRNGLQAAVVEDGKAEIRKVSVTRDLGTQVEVGAGVKAGDRVILNPPVTLTDGSKVLLEDSKAQPHPATKVEPRPATTPAPRDPAAQSDGVG